MTNNEMAKGIQRGKTEQITSARYIFGNIKSLSRERRKEKYLKMDSRFLENKQDDFARKSIILLGPPFMKQTGPDATALRAKAYKY